MEMACGVMDPGVGATKKWAFCDTTLCFKVAPFAPAQGSRCASSFYNRKASTKTLCALEEYIFGVL